MEKISDFFKEIKDRLSNPLISSFIIAWLIANWRITIGLVFYKVSDLKLDGYHSYDDLISKNINLQNNLILPLTVSLAYTFIFPLLKNVIYAFGAWIKRWGNEWTLNISRNGSISVNNYIKLKEQYDRLIKQLVLITESESEIKNKNSELQIDLIELQKKHDLLENDIARIRSNTSVDSLRGRWRYKIFSTGNKPPDENYSLGDKIEINDQTLEIYQNNGILQSYSINTIVGNLTQMVLVLVSNNDRKAVDITTWVFNVTSGLNLLQGRDMSGNTIQMERWRT